MRTMNYIIVPDGLAASDSGKALTKPSFVFRWVLDWLVENIQKEDVIYLAPANKFGGNISEQEAAKKYLNKTIPNTIVSFEPSEERYIDTRGNAVLLRDYLNDQNKWPLNNATLVSYCFHLPRANLVFRQAGYNFQSVGVRPSKFHSEAIVPRLWYYQYPYIHIIYETLAYCYFYITGFSKKVR